MSETTMKVKGRKVSRHQGQGRKRHLRDVRMDNQPSREALNKGADTLDKWLKDGAR